MKSLHVRTIILSATALSALVLGGGAQAQTAPPPNTAAAEPDQTGVDDIVVTAQKRSESLQKVPLAITAVTSDDLARSGVTDLQGVVALVPSLNLGQQLGVAKIALRGIGLENLSPGAEGSIAFHVDGVFISRSIAALPSFYDVAQVEVLRGPQGTLYGRNATGGAINIITRDPTQELSGYGNVMVGNYGRVVTEGAVGGPIVKGVLAARIAFQTQDREGYGTNVVTGNDIDNLKTRAVRGSLLFTPTSRLSIEVKGDYFWERDRSGGYHYLGAAGFSAPGVPITPSGFLAGGTVSGDPRNISSAIDPTNNVEFWGISGKVSYDLGSDIEFRSLTAYRRTDFSVRTDVNGTSAPLTLGSQGERDTQFSQEFQLAGKGDRYNWLVGFFYFRENDGGFSAVPFNNRLVGIPAPGTLVQGYFAGGSIKTDALAAFGQASYEIVDNLRLTVGARYSSEKKTDRDEFALDFVTPYNPNVPLALTTQNQGKRWTSFTPRVALDYQVTPDVLAYASWSKGFKAGTYNLGGLQPPVNPEKVSAYEAGIKSTWFDRRLRFNLAGFYYDYRDLQIGKLVLGSVRLENAATATIYGLEAEMQGRIGPRFQIDANASWLHARFDKFVSGDPARPFGDGSTTDPDSGAPAFNLAGHKLSQSPDFTFFVGAQYELPTKAGSFTLRGEIAWRDRVYYTPFNLNYLSQGPNAKGNVFLNWESPGADWTISLFVKNVANKTTVGNSYVGSILVGFPILGYVEEPRTFGARVGVKF